MLYYTEASKLFVVYMICIKCSWT